MARSRPSPRLILKLSLAYRGVHAWAARQDQSLTLARAGALFLLGGPKQNLTMGDLAVKLGLGLSGASGLIDRMVEDGLVEKQRDAADGRRWCLTLTERGKRERRRASRGARTLNTALCDGFSDRELDVVVRWLEHAARMPRTLESDR